MSHWHSLTLCNTNRHSKNPNLKSYQNSGPSLTRQIDPTHRFSLHWMSHEPCRLLLLKNPEVIKAQHLTLTSVISTLYGCMYVHKVVVSNTNIVYMYAYSEAGRGGGGGGGGGRGRGGTAHACIQIRSINNTAGKQLCTQNLTRIWLNLFDCWKQQQTYQDL